MAIAPNRRSVMTLFSSDGCAPSHCARIVLAEKGVTVEISVVDPESPTEELAELNPYGTLPTLLDRDLVLYDLRVILEYLDERFPHPPLMPVDPVSRAQARLLLYRIERDWYSAIADIESDSKSRQTAGRKELRESIAAANDLFAAMPFFLSEEFSLVDCIVIPVIWRLQHWKIELPKQATAVQAYAERMFARESVASSLSEFEEEMRG